MEKQQAARKPGAERLRGEREEMGQRGMQSQPMGTLGAIITTLSVPLISIGSHCKDLSRGVPTLFKQLPFPLPLAPGNHHSTFCFYDFDYFRYLL